MMSIDDNKLKESKKLHELFEVYHKNYILSTSLEKRQEFPTRKNSEIYVAEFARIRADKFPKSWDFGYGIISWGISREAERRMMKRSIRNFCLT